MDVSSDSSSRVDERDRFIMRYTSAVDVVASSKTLT